MGERVYFMLAAPDVIRLGRILEGCGHLGLLSTVDSKTGLCMIRTTADRMPEVLALLQNVPISLEIVPAPAT